MNKLKQTVKNVCRTAAVLALVCVPLAAAQAAEVDAVTAERVARAFWNAHRDKHVAPLTHAMRLLELRWDAFHVFVSDEAEGFVVVAADDCVRPVLAYSFGNAFMRDSVGRETAWWLDGWQGQVDACRAVGLKATPSVAARWQRLLDGSEPEHPAKTMEPMLETQWDQDAPYNDSCPVKSGRWGGSRKAYTGCVATALAQVMRYWQWPVRGTGSHTYTAMDPNNPLREGFGQQTVDFGATTYDWDNMPAMLNSISSTAEKSAVATLMYHCGVACNMMYGGDFEGGSGAMVTNYMPIFSSLHNGIVRYFGYSSQCRGVTRKHIDDSTWNALIATEIEARRPVIFGGGDSESGGHSFVCDGVDAEGLFHFNWGWSGSGDGYYTLDNLAPGTGGIGGGTGTYNFTNDQEAIIGMQPHGDDDSLCIIRHFPYVMDFESSPGCWDATTSSQYSISWIVDEVEANGGHYVAGASRSYYGTASDSLFSPLLIGPGRYTVAWLDKVSGSARNVTYEVLVDTITLFSGNAGSDWTGHLDTLTLAAGDTVRLVFVTSTGNIMVDNVEVDRLGGDAAVAAVEAGGLHVAVYPNPACGDVTVRTGQPADVHVVDLSGRTVYRVSCQGDAVRLPHALLRPGAYIVRVATPVGVAAQRLLVR